MKVIKQLLAKPHIDPAGRDHLICKYIDVCRQGRILNVAQWETAHGLSAGWHGTLDELVAAAKGLS